MNEQIIKLDKVKKSCKAVKIVSMILFVLTLAGTLLTLITGIVFMNSGSKYDDSLQSFLSNENTRITFGDGIIKYSEDGKTFVSNLRSDVSSLDEKLSDMSLTFSVGIFCMVIAVIFITISVPIYCFYSVFNLISKEESPFSDRVIKRLRICFVVITVVLFLTTNNGVAILSAFFTWALYTIMDYGRILQIQSDETL